MERDPKTWIIVKEAYGADSTNLIFKKGNGEVGTYTANEENTLIIPDTTEIDEFINKFINEDTLVLDMTNIKSYDEASQCIQKIKVKIDVVLFIGSAGYGDEFSLVGNDYITTFSIRQQTGTNTSSGVILSLYENSNLTTIDVDRFRLNTLYAKDCPKLSGNLDLQYVTLVNIDDSINIIDVGYTNSSTTNQGITEITLPNKNINSISMTNCNVITNLTFPNSVKTSLQSLNVNGCKKLANFNDDGIQNTLDLSGFTVLTTFNADYTAYASVKFGSGISYISMKDCGNFERIEFSESYISTLYLNDCSNLTLIAKLTPQNFSEESTINLSGTGITEISISSLNIANIVYPNNMAKLNIQSSPYNGSLDLSQYGELTSVTLDGCSNLSSITLNSLTKCESINIINPGSSEIFIGDTANGNFVLDEFSSLDNLTITNYNIGAISISSTTVDPPLETLNITSPNCESINFSFDIFTNIQTLSLANCVKLHTFNGNSNTFSTNGSTSLINIDLTKTLFNTVDMYGSSNIKKIILNNCSNLSTLDFSSASDISKLDLENCSKFTEQMVLSTSNFSKSPIINMPGSDITVISIDELDLTNIKYPEGMTELTITKSPNGGELDLSDYTSLASLTLNSCANLTGFNIYERVTTLTLDSCAKLSGDYKIPDAVMTCSINKCGFTKIRSDGEKTKITLKELSECETIAIENTSISSICIGADITGPFVLDGFSKLKTLLISHYDIETVSLSITSTTSTSILETLKLPVSTCKVINLPFEKFPNIETLDLTDCELLATFNYSENSTATNNIFNIDNYKKLQYLDISNTKMTSIVGDYESEAEGDFKMKIYASHEGFESMTLHKRKIEEMRFSYNGFLTIECKSCSFTDNTLDLSNYNTLTKVTLDSCGLTKFTPNTSVVSLDVSNNNSLTGFTIDNNSTTNISSLTQLKSLNILGTSISTLEISNPEAERRSITDLTLSESTSELTLGNVNYQDNFSVPDYLKSLNLTNCGIQTVSSENKHTDEFSLNVDGGNFKSFDITNFDEILNLQVGGPDTNTFNFIKDGETVTGLSGSKWNNTKIFNISGVSLSNLHIDLKDNDNQISDFNVTPSNLEALSINGWNPNLNKNSINFSTDKLQALSLTNSEVNITLPTEFKNMPELRALDISGSPFTTLNFEYESPNANLASIKAGLCSSLTEISLKNTGELSELKLNGCESLSSLTINGERTNNITSLTKLKSLDISGTQITSLTYKGTSESPKILETISLPNSLTSLKLAYCTSLTSQIDPSNMTDLVTFEIPKCSQSSDMSFNSTKLTKVDLSNNNSISNIELSGTITSLNLENTSISEPFIDSSESAEPSYYGMTASNLSTLKLAGTEILNVSIPYKGNTMGKIKDLSLPSNCSYLNISGQNEIQDKSDPDNIKNLSAILGSCENLSTLIANNCGLSEELVLKSSLSKVDLSNNNITSIKLSGTITSLNLENTSISTDFSSSTDPQYYGMNTSSLSTLKLAETQIKNISIPYGSYNQDKTMGKITDLSLPSSCTALNISNQTAIKDKSDPDNIKDLSSILGSCKNLNTLIANNCGLSGTLVIESPLSNISLADNSELSTFDLSKYDSLTSFDLSGTSIANININSTGTIANAIYPVTTENITFTKAIFDESLKTPTFSGTNLPDLKTLYLANTNITSLTCSSCPALKYIILARINRQTRESTVNNSLTSLTATNCKELQTLQVYNYAILTNLDLAGCSKFYGTTDENGELVSFAESTPYLEELNISGTAVLNIDCNGITSLESLVLPSSSQYIYVSECPQLTSLDISGCENLKILDAQKSGISSLTTSSAKQATLTEINMSSTSIPSIDLANYTSLQTIDCNGITFLKSLSLPSSSQNIDVSGCSNLPNLDISNCENLEQLDAHESGISSIKTSTNEQTGLTSIANYTSLQTINLSKTNIKDLEILNLESLTELKLGNNELTTFSIDGCKELENNYLKDLKITGSATFKNSGSTVPQGISTITPSSLTITETDWNSFSLNGALLNNSGNSITIKLNNNLESLSFDSKPDSPTYKNLDISYNIKLESINKTTNILDICRLLNANLIKFNDIENYDELNINLVMNAFTADDKTELPQYLGIWPQITDSGDNSGKLLGEINFTAAAAGKEVTGEFIGLHEETEEIENLLQYSFNNITVWDVGKYETSEDLSKLSFGPILSLYVADVDGNVPDGPIDISVNGEDRELFDIIGSMFDDETKNKPEIIYTNSNRLKTLAENKGIPVQILHTSTENWNSGYPYPNVFKIYFIMDK